MVNTPPLEEAAAHPSARRVLVIGGSGMLGADLLEVLRRRAFVVRAPSSSELDVRARPQVVAGLDDFGPDVVIFAAGYTSVDDAEDERERCFALNADAPGAMADECARRRLPLFYFSTDYVFDGETDAPYEETNEPRPLNVYGASKLEGERRVLAASPAHCVVRVSWLQGPRPHPRRGNFIEAILRAAETRDRLSVVDDQRGTPTFTFDVAERVADLVGVAATGLVHCAGEGEATWRELAEAVLAEAGVRGVVVEPTTTEEYGARAPRPRYSALANARLATLGLCSMPNWRASLTDYFRRRAPRKRS